ncbi:MAG: response regulator transcription factor, partial [Planctomycetota bacterium]|nr:response regulator transcription factor [Planctomycetota bacterium]
GLLLEGPFPFDLVVLDLMLPGMSGYEICKEIRGFNENIPIMVLSARSSSEDKAHAFDCGADQYVTKPFDLNEVLSRVRNLFKWRKTDNSDASETVSQSIDVYRFDDVKVDCPKFQVTVKGELFTLTTMEIQLLRYFLENQGIVLSRSRIMENVWGQSAEITTRTIDNFVMRLRRIIEPETSKPRYIVSVRGTGYKFIKVQDP